MRFAGFYYDLNQGRIQSSSEGAGIANPKLGVKLL
jgi:hypothetical protein